jgi:uncharacterized protein YbbC (DUF1343 family)
VLLALMTAVALAAPAPVQVGLDRVAADGGRPLRGERVGLIANGASVSAGGRRSVDVLRAHGVRVVRLFAPEHGLSGRRGAGAPVRGGVDQRTGIPVVSLYGAHLSPTAADLRGLDALVYDLQDAGVRFYTYESTMILAMRAAARHRVRFVVLDRPDPLGGERVEGPVADLHARRHLRGPLSVVPMRGWRRSMTWAQTGRRWVAPSPNLRTPQAALLYPGTGLLESTTASEGRGTREPFRTVGAPWARAAPLVRAATRDGVRAVATTFTPRASRAAPAPKFAGRRCTGVRLTATDPAAPTFSLGLRLVRALQTRPGFALRPGFDVQLGTGRVRAALRRGAPVSSILASEAAAIARWRAARRPYLLY